MFSESHCHLGDMTPADVKRAEDERLEIMITMGLDEQSTLVSMKLAKRHKSVRLSLAVHPWYSDEYDEEIQRRFLRLAKNPEVVAIGETGLDYTGRMNHQWLREDHYVDKEVQREVFKAHIQLAIDLKLPVIVHDRGEDQEALDILEKMNASKTGVIIHGYSRDEAYARRCEELGIHLSLGLRTLQTMPLGLETTIKQAPMRLIVTETDSNKPWEVIKVCEIIGKIKGLATEEVGSIATNNLKRLIRQ